MSCPAEPELLLYVDAELSGPALRELEGHLVGCRDCRARVVALRDESLLLGDVLAGRERAVAGVRAASRPPAPEPSVALGLPAAVAAVTAAIAFLGFLLETRVPGGLDLLNPLRLKGAYEMAFDLIFLVRDRAPGALELAASIGVVAGVSAVLSFAVGALYRHVFGATAALLLALLAGAAQPAQALDVRLDQDTQVAAGEVVGESMLLTGDVVHVDGVIDGDLIVGAERVTIGGRVAGSVYVLARHLEITGRVEGRLHGVVEHSRIDGEVLDSVYQVGESVTLAPHARVGRDLSLIAEDGILGGEVARDVLFGGRRLELRSRVGRDVEVRWAQGVALRDGARIGGDVQVVLEDEEALERAPGARIAGSLDVQAHKSVREHYLAAYRDPSVWALHGIGLVAAFLFGLLLRFLVPAIFDVRLTTGAEFFRSLGYGFLVVVATPFAILALLLTVVGIPVAVLTLFAYVVLLYSAEIVVGAWLGRLVWPPPDDGIYAFGRSFFVGLTLLVLATHVPFLGPPVFIVALLIGAGLLFDRARRLALPRAQAW